MMMTFIELSIHSNYAVLIYKDTMYYKSKTLEKFLQYDRYSLKTKIIPHSLKIKVKI